jgi:hypothetical protein
VALHSLRWLHVLTLDLRLQQADEEEDGDEEVAAAGVLVSMRLVMHANRANGRH